MLKTNQTGLALCLQNVKVSFKTKGCLNDTKKNRYEQFENLILQSIAQKYCSLFFFSPQTQDLFLEPKSVNIFEEVFE